MGRRLQTIYEYLSDYQENEINAAINNLSLEEKLVVEKRYGEDLHNPKTCEDWNSLLAAKFYGNIIPKLKGVLEERSKYTITIENNSEDLAFTLI